MSSATLLRGRTDIRKTAVADIASGDIHQLANGQAGVYQGLNATPSGATASWTQEGQYRVTKTASVVILDGAPVYWDRSAGSATPLTPTSDRDFFLGTALGDAAGSDTTVVVNLNVKPVYEVQLTKGTWTAEATNGLGVTLLPGGGVQLAFDAVAEAAQAALYSERTFAVAANCIVEGRMAIFNVGDNAALDFDIGLAISSHATDFQTITEFISLHFDGNDLSLLIQSDDGTTDVAPTDTTTDAVDDTYFDFALDLRDPSDIQCYINGVLKLGSTTFTLGAAAGPIKAIIHMEKTSDDTVADVRVDFLNVRTAEQ